METMTFDAIQPLLLGVGALLLVASMGACTFRAMQGRPAGWGVPAGIFVMLAGVAALPAVMRIGETVGEDKPAPPPPPADTGQGSSALDQGTGAFEDPAMYWILGALIATGTGIFVMVALGVMLYQRRRAKAEAEQADAEMQAEASRLWDRHVTALNGLKENYIAFETDPWSAFRRPLLADVAEPETAAFHDAFAHAQDLHTGTRPKSRSAVDDFGAAVRAANRAWEVADQHAREVAVPTTSEADRRRLRQAEGALQLAMDANASAAERRVALERVEELIKGLTVMPKQARTAMVAELDHVQRAAIDS